MKGIGPIECHEQVDPPDDPPLSEGVCRCGRLKQETIEVRAVEGEGVRGQRSERQGFRQPGCGNSPFREMARDRRDVVTKLLGNLNSIREAVLDRLTQESGQALLAKEDQFPPDPDEFPFQVDFGDGHVGVSLSLGLI